MGYSFWIKILHVPLVSLLGCGNPIEHHIARLVEGGDAAEEAKLALNLAGKPAIEPLLAAFQDRQYPSHVRVDLAQALYRLYLREDDKRLLDALFAGLADPDSRVRTGVVQALGDLGKRAGIKPLIDQLGRETEPAVRHEILVSLEILCGMGKAFGMFEAEMMTEVETQRFTEILLQMAQETGTDFLQSNVLEWLEVLAEERAKEASQRYLEADVQGAESRLLSALELVPHSKNIGYQLGRLYYDSGQRERGLRYLQARGLVAHAAQLPAAPQIDGALDEAAWAKVEPITQFYQCIWRMSAVPAQGRAEAYFGYRDQTLYCLVKGYEPNTEGLVAKATQRDSRVYADDCVELFFDTNHDSQTFFQYIINTIGTYVDDDEGPGSQGRGWNSDIRVATAVSDTFWVMEIAVPAATLKGARFTPGDIWGFNIARVRIGNASEYAQWVPTYGAAERPDRFGFLIFE